MIKKPSCCILLFFTIQLIFAQNTTQKTYDLYGKPKEATIVLLKESRIDETSNGIVSIEHLDQKIEGELTTFSFKNFTKTKFGKNKLEKTFLRDRTNFIANIMDQTLNSRDSSSLEGKTILFSKDKYDLWTVSNFDEYTSNEQDDLNSELVSLNDTLIKLNTYFKYPKKMRIGEQFELNSENIYSFYDIRNVKDASGVIELKEVVTRKNDMLAVFDITIKIRGLADAEDEAYISIEMDGTIERSLRNYYDQKISVSGTIQMSGKLSDSEYLTMVIPATMIIKQTLE